MYFKTIQYLQTVLYLIRYNNGWFQFFTAALTVATCTTTTVHYYYNLCYSYWYCTLLYLLFVMLVLKWGPCTVSQNTMSIRKGRKYTFIIFVKQPTFALCVYKVIFGTAVLSWWNVLYGTSLFSVFMCSDLSIVKSFR